MDTLHNRIDLINVPFTERGSRLLIFRKNHQFAIRLAERWTKWESKVGHYRQRPPLITDFTFLNGSGEVVYDQTLETYPHLMQITNALGDFRCTFLDTETFLIRLPDGEYSFDFNVFVEKGTTDSRGGTFQGKRNIAYTCDAELLSNSITNQGEENLKVRLSVRARSGDVLLLHITPRLAFNRSIPDSAVVFERVRASWQAWFAATPPVLDQYRSHYDYAWWVMRANLVSPRYYFTREAMFPSKVHYVGVWHWDQVFHALAYRYVDTQLAEDQIRILIDHQREDGLLPDAIHDEGVVNHLSLPVDADVTKPPIIGWGALKLFETSGRLDFLKEVYEPLKRWHQWWIDQNRHSSGLCEYRQPFSSGLDDNPLWDAGMPVVAPDLNTFLVIQCDSLAQIARLIGKEHDAAHYERLSTSLLDGMITHLWDEQAGLFRALHADKPLPTTTPFNLFPLLTAKLPSAMTERLVDNLFDPDQFWSPFPLTTVSIADPAFNPMQMWRGPVWINTNYLFVEALLKNGLTDQAIRLRQKTLDLVMQHSDIFEYYHPFTAEKPPKAAPMFGWSAALFIEMALAETRRHHDSATMTRL